MEYTLSVDQLALKRWHRKVDGDDALIIAFIEKLNPHNDAVKAKMRRGYFRFSRPWVLAEIPLLRFGVVTLSRKIKRLGDLGIIDIDNTPEGGHFSLYVKLSKTYFQEAEKAKIEASAMKTMPSKLTLSKMTASKSKNDSVKKAERSYKEIKEPPPPLMAAGGVSEEKKTGPRCPNCGRTSEYLDWPTCSHCSHEWPGGGTARQYLARNMPEFPPAEKTATVVDFPEAPPEDDFPEAVGDFPEAVGDFPEAVDDFPEAKE